MSDATVYVNGIARGAATTTGDGIFKLDPSITVTNGDTVHFTYTTTTTAGVWFGTNPFDLDMTDWPASDIIDHFAKDLAKRRPA